MKKQFLDLKHFISVIVWTWRFVRPWRGKFLFGVLLGCLQPAWMGATLSLFLKKATEIMYSLDMAALWRMLALIGGSLLLGFLIFPIAFYLIYSTYARGVGQMRREVFDHIQNLSADYVEDNLSSELLTRMTADINDTSQLFGYPAVGQWNIVSVLIGAIVMGVLIIVENVALGIPLVALSLLSVLFIIRFAPKIRDAEQAVKASITSLTQQMLDAMAGNSVVRMFGLMHRQKDDYAQGAQGAYGHAMRAVRVQALSGTLGFGYGWMLAIVLFVAGIIYAVTTGDITIPSVMYLTNLSLRFVMYVQNLGQNYNRLQPYVVAAERLKALMDAPEELEREGIAVPDMTAANAVEIEHLTFGYTQERVIIGDLSLRVRTGERLAIVGASGGGKTTLLKLLLDFCEHDRDSIRIFGKKQRDYSQQKMRELMAYVPQDCHLFDGSLRENIYWGNMDATQAQVEEAARRAGLGELIGKLPQGLDTQVGEFGSQLSGGERQRVAIARAILRDAPLLLLDEATSSLDSQSEQAIQEALEVLMRGRTSIIIAHRLQTIQEADRIIVLEGGAVAEEGAHRELLARGGRYAKLYSMQFL